MDERPKLSLAKIFELLRPYRGRWWIATLCLFSAAFIRLALPQPVRLAIDDAVTHGDADGLTDLVVLAFVAFGMLAALAYVRGYLIGWLGGRIVADMRIKTFGRLLQQSPGFFHVRASGALVSRLTSDITMVSFAVGAELSIALKAVLTIAGGLALLIWTDPMLTLVMVLTAPPVGVGAVWARRRIIRRSREIQDEVASANARLKEALVGIENVQAFTAEDREQARYGGRIEAAFDSSVRLTVVRSIFYATVQFTGYAAIALILWFGGSRVIEGGLSAGELTAFMLYTFMVTDAFMGLAQVWANLQRAAGASDRIFELLAEVPTIVDPPGAVALDEVRGEVVFDGVGFTYPTRPDERVLDGVSFVVAPGQCVALVGRSGAGKSTIAALIHRFHDPNEGAIRVDGHDLRSVKIADLRAAIGTVHQEPMLFSGPIRENIGYGVADATDEAVRDAARNACIADFVEGLTKGYDTEVGERGVRLSGGERQRIAIARAMLADPRILILDEATSHLDTVNEALVQRALERLMKDRTTLIIAHRLSTVRNADRILVVDHGRIVDEGTHDELLARGGVYGELVAKQALVA